MGDKFVTLALNKNLGGIILVGLAMATAQVIAGVTVELIMTVGTEATEKAKTWIKDKKRDKAKVQLRNRLRVIAN